MVARWRFRPVPILAVLALAVLLLAAGLVAGYSGDNPRLCWLLGRRNLFIWYDDALSGSVLWINAEQVPLGRENPDPIVRYIAKRDFPLRVRAERNGRLIWQEIIQGWCSEIYLSVRNDRDGSSQTVRRSGRN
jgi:hypothetical protein